MNRFLTILLVIGLFGCAGKDGDTGPKGDVGPTGDDFSVTDSGYCSDQWNDHPDYYGVYSSVAYTEFSNGVIFWQVSITVNNYPEEFQQIIETAWQGKGYSFPYLSIINFKLWEFKLIGANGYSVTQGSLVHNVQCY